MNRLNVQDGNTVCHDGRPIQNRLAMFRLHLVEGLIPVELNHQWKHDDLQVVH